MAAAMAQPVFTIGHSTHPIEAFLALLRESRVACLVDVRRLPGSRAFPQYDADALRASLAAAGIDYWYLAELGGRRGGSRRFPDARNALWRNASFRHYADYAMGTEFRDGLRQLERRAADTRCAVMCAEAVWWRCHRRIIADHLLADGFEVWHIMAPGKVVAATPTPGAVFTRAGVSYPAPDTDGATT